jgi:hypothetical protein
MFKKYLFNAKKELNHGSDFESWQFSEDSCKNQDILLFSLRFLVNKSKEAWLAF